MERRLALRVVRGFLLVILALGVYGMHTLGHVEGGHGGSSAAGMVREFVPEGMRAFVPEGGMPGLDPTSVCLAVLTSFVIVLVLAAWIKARRRTFRDPWSLSPVQQVARPPPKRTSLRLARLSMLLI
ncbi:hypothetical protein AB0F17_63610 [Nonomuraea sp. NPDC026600]|uniref:hypothetical protein n=1 Tax=Nonomuraea sp. NPDC026600 TaxID=3155363 RepID=UPI0033FBEB3A